MSDETGEQRYWANSDEGIIRTLRGKVERLRAEIAGLAAERSLHQDAAMTLLEQRDKLLDEIHGGERRTATLEAENARLREALEGSCSTNPGDRDHPCWCESWRLNHSNDCMSRRAALAAPTSGDADQT